MPPVTHERRKLARELLGLVALSAALLGLLALLVPDIPPLEILGGDAPNYARMAEDPLEPVSGSPAAERLLTPLVVALLPFELATGFFVLGFVSMVASAVLVALVAREVGLGYAHQAAAAALTVGSYIGVHAVFNQYYVDPEILAVVALALLLAHRRRWLAFVAVAALGVAVKEIAATLVVVPYLVLLPSGRLWDREAARRTLLLAVPVLAAFLAVQAFAPAADLPGGDPRLTLDPRDAFVRGFLTTAVNPIFALFGAVWALWPLGLRRASHELVRLQLWMLFAGPILGLGNWERTLGVFLPLVIPVALCALRDARVPPVVLVAAGSFWVSGVAGALTIGEGETSVARKLALIAPGLLLAWGAAAYELWSRRQGYDRTGTDRRRLSAAQAAQPASARTPASRAP